MFHWSVCFYASTRQFLKSYNYHLAELEFEFTLSPEAMSLTLHKNGFFTVVFSFKWIIEVKIKILPNHGQPDILLT